MLKCLLLKGAKLINKDFFFKRDLIIFGAISAIGISTIISTVTLNYPKIDKEKINQKKVAYQRILQQKRNYQEKLIKNQKRYVFYKKYLFTREEIGKIKKILDMFNGMLSKLQVTRCQITNYAYDKVYLNVLSMKVACNTPTDAKKYQLIFNYFFSDLQKNNVVKIKEIKRENNIIIMKFFKYAKGY